MLLKKHKNFSIFIYLFFFQPLLKENSLEQLAREVDIPPVTDPDVSQVPEKGWNKYFNPQVRLKAVLELQRKVSPISSKACDFLWSWQISRKSFRKLWMPLDWGEANQDRLNCQFCTKNWSADLTCLIKNKRLPSNNVCFVIPFS